MGCYEISRLSPPTPKRVFRQALFSVPTISTPATQDILQLLTHSFREIHISELQDLVDRQLLGPVTPFASGRTLENLEERIRTWFGPLIHVDGNRIVFGHPQLRRFLAHNSATQKPNEATQKMAHEKIARLCLAYGYSTKGRAAMLRCLDSALPYTGLRLDFASYALKYLPMHLEMCETSWGQVMSEVHTEELPLRLWAKAHWIRPLPAAESPVSSLTLFARYGVSDMLNRAIEALKGLPCFRKECLLGLEAAVGSGVPESRCLPVVEKRLTCLSEAQDSSLHQTESLQFAILAALEGGNASIAEKIVNKALEDEGGFKPANEQRDEILHCAALRGALDVVKLLLETGSQTDIMDVGRQNGRTLLHDACLGSHADVVKLLIEKGHDIEFLGDPHCQYTPLQTACLYDNAAVVSYLVEQALPKPKPDQSNADKVDGGLEAVEGAIKLATSHGQPRILEILTSAMERQSGKLDRYRLISKAVVQGRVNCLRQTLASLKTTKDEEPRSLASEIRVAIERLDFPGLQVLLDEADISPDEADFKTIFAAVNNNWTEASEDTLIAITQHLCDKAGQALSEEGYSRVTDGAFWNAAELRTLNEGHLSCLIQNGANINAKKVEGYDSDKTPIYDAAYCDRAKHVEYLLSCGADPNIPCTEGQWTAAHAAYDSAVVVRALMKHEKLDLNTPDSEGGTVLYYASKWNKVDVVKELLGAGAELEHRSVESGSEKTALEIALEYGHSAVLALFIQAGACVSKHQLEDDTLHRCVSNNDAESLKALLLLDVDIAAKDAQGGTALHCIDSETDVLLLRLLVNRGTPIDNTNDWEQTPLCVAVMEENLKAAEFLISRGVQLNIKAGQRGGPLHRACRFASLSMVKLLCEKGADVNLADPSSAGTPLQAACRREDNTEVTEFISYLVETQAADINKASDWWGGALFIACLNCPLDSVQFLLEHEADVQACDHVLRQPIHLALYNRKEHVQLLCKYGAVLTSTDALGRTALHCAGLSRRPDVVEYVLDKHPEQLQAKDVDGWIPLMWSIRPCTSWHGTEDDKPDILPIVRTLLSHHDSAHAAEQKLHVAIGEPQEESGPSGAPETRWTALKLAKQYAMEEELIDLLTPSEEDIAQSDEATRTFWKSTSETEDNTAVNSPVDLESSGFCDVCLVDLVGIWYACMACQVYAYSLCFKCFNSREKVHDAEHAFQFRQIGADEYGLARAASDSDQESGYLRDEDTDDDDVEVEPIVEEEDSEEDM
ncbi:ankyrin repeat-containing domain protein [Rhypophila decipiens]|uniref:Ankyrin repeat-containing domain protein n=1 Tax=Rhypophila decipiens TaxID=261697 RepID=A0AAN6YN04_9PEZI|nr:ankyrin repeat-containing domain protein [Rhypophila decipiens]